jgi:RecQ family ATP-dependent DNA helicase
MEEELESTMNPIFVFMGMNDYVNMNEFDKFIVDKDSFQKNDNSQFFNQTWFAQVFTELNNAMANPDIPYTILSFPQFSYLISYIQPEFFKNRLILVRDGFRSLLPLEKSEFIEKVGQENIEERNEAMPIYMAEQMQIGDKFYYSVKTPLEEFMTIDVFTEQKPLLLLPEDDTHEVIDTVSDPHGIDIFINRCLSEGDFDKNVIVKIFQKQPMNKQAKMMLEKLNWLLGQFGGQLYELDESAIQEEFHPSEETLHLLKQYWGTNATFRELSVYKNPDYGKEIINISQGLIVETIINEYKNAKAGKDVKDLFLTAPTGAGKSLLFQLPAFYVSSQKDVTIVVSPLIALMRDQVEQIRQERGFEKVFFLNSELSLIDRDKVIEDCQNGDIDILYLSPELLLSYDITYFIGEKRKLGLLVIDEAHLITTWGRDFRVDYWFLGQHINKIRKNHDYHFPLVAVTATAIYGGDNDMVFDSVNSLYMHDPHLFIGEVKRKNITFVIDNHDKYKSNYDSEKEKETVKFIESIAEEGVKTIVYAPYRKHIDNLIQRLEADGKDGIAVAYHSGLSADNKNLAYSSFKDNEAKVMISTKAFGMGVDIPDIQLVYHHAPSGLLPDYVQEVGRAARKPEINGFAALSYALDDQRYSKILHGISALRHYQVREVINKINKMFVANGKKRNMLVSADDFSYIFDNALDNDQKVMTSLMMIEKDYLAKYRFNVLIARPKKLFVKVYCRVNRYGLQLLKQKYKGCFTELRAVTDELTVVELDLDKIWKKSFSDCSFPMIKRDFYEGRLLKEDNVECKPQVKLTFTLETDFDRANRKLAGLLDTIQSTLTRLSGHYFSKEELEEELSRQLTDDVVREKVVKFLLATYSGRGTVPNQIDNDAFLQRRRNTKQEEQYRVFNNQYTHNFATLKRRMQKLFEGVPGNMSSLYTSYGGEYLTNYIRLGSLMEILGIGTYESRGGDNPMIFIRINDPRRIAKDAADVSYRNSLLTTIERRYKSSSDIFDHFFLHSFENEDRWNFIEDFFLGESNDELFTKYPGSERNHIDIISYVRDHMNIVNTDGASDKKSVEGINTFAPKEGRTYYPNDLLTIDAKTKKISKWLIDNPVELDKVRRKYKLSIEKETYLVLMSKLRADFFPYYRDVLGLKLQIVFPGYDSMVAAKVPYQDMPVKFYKWWRKNEDKITMTKKETIELLLKVNELSPTALIKKHREILEKKVI